MVVIHGIGEQRPMDTVRGFVKAVVPLNNPSKPRFWSKPDPMSKIFVAGAEASPISACSGSGTESRLISTRFTQSIKHPAHG
jgi:hypothetical protein